MTLGGPFGNTPADGSPKSGEGCPGQQATTTPRVSGDARHCCDSRIIASPRSSQIVSGRRGVSSVVEMSRRRQPRGVCGMCHLQCASPKARAFKVEVAQKGAEDLPSAAGIVKPMEPSSTDCPAGSSGSEKKGDEVRVGGTLVKLRELSVLIRRLTPEEIMLHTRKSSRKRKADGSKTPRNKNELQKKFRRIWVVSDNSDDDSESTIRTVHEDCNSSAITSDYQCDSNESIQDQEGCPEVKKGKKKDPKDYKLCNKGGNTISGRSCGKQHSKKPTGNQVKKGCLTESDISSVVNQNNGELHQGTKVKNNRRDSEASRDSNGKVNSGSYQGKTVAPREPSNVEPPPVNVNNKLAVPSNGPTFADSINLPDRLFIPNGERTKIPKNNSHNSSLPKQSVKPKKYPAKPHKEADCGKNKMNDLKSGSVPATSKSLGVSSLRQNSSPFSSPVQTVENTPSLPEKAASKEISRGNRDCISKELHTVNSSEKPLESIAVHGFKGFSSKTIKNTDSNLINSDKHNSNAIPGRLVKKSTVLAEISSPKEVVTSDSSILLKEIPSTSSKEKPGVNSASDHGKEHKAKANVVEKSAMNKDSHVVEGDKYSKCASPVRLRENVPVSSEIPFVSSKEKLVVESVTVLGKEHKAKANVVEKSTKNKDGHVVEGDKYSKCASPVRLRENVPVSSEIPSISKEKLVVESVTVLDKEHKAKANVVEKSAINNDGHVVEGDKYSKCASPVRLRENVPVSSEIPSISKEKLVVESVIVLGKEHKAKANVVEKSTINNDGHVVGGDKYSKCASPVRLRENVPVSSEIPSVSSKEKLVVESVTVLGKEHKAKANVVEKSTKNKDVHVVEGDRYSKCASPVRQQENVPISSEVPSISFKEKPGVDSVSVHGKDHKAKAYVVEKSTQNKDGHVVEGDKYSKCSSPVTHQENVPVSSENLAQKKTGNSGILTKESHTLPVKEQLHGNSVPVSGKGLESKEKCMGKKVRSKDDHLLSDDLSKKCASPVRPSVLRSPPQNERNRPKEISKRKSISSNDKHATLLQEKPQIAQDHHIKESSSEKIAPMKDTSNSFEAPNKVIHPNIAYKNAEISHDIQGPDDILTSDYASKDMEHVSNETETPSSEEQPSGSDSNSGNELHINNSEHAGNVSTIGELSKQFTKTVKGIENITPNTEEVKSAGHQESIPAKSRDRSVKEFNPVLNQESKPKKKHITQFTKSKDPPVVREIPKQFANPTPVTDNLVETVAVSELQSASSSELVTSNESTSNDSIHPKAMSKRSHTNAEKVRHTSRTSESRTVPLIHGRHSHDKVTTGPCQNAKDMCRREKGKAKIASEKPQLLSKIEKTSRRLSKNGRLSAEAHVSNSTTDPKVVEKLSASIIKSKEMSIISNSQPISKVNQKSVKSSETSENEVMVLGTSLIEKSGCSSDPKKASPSAIEADSVDQLMTEYETLTKQESSKLLVEKKSERKLNQKKILNIFGEEHLVEDSESMMMKSDIIVDHSKPTNTIAINFPVLKSFTSLLDVDPSMQVAEITDSVVPLSNTGGNKRKNSDDVKASTKKRKLSCPGSGKVAGKSRRHSLDTSSSMPRKKYIGRGRSSLDRTNSCIETNHGNLSPNRRSQDIKSSINCSNVDLGTCRHVSVICRDVGRMRKKEGEERLVADGKFLPSLPKEISNLDEKASAGGYSSGEDSDITILDHHYPVKEDKLEDMEEKVNPSNPESTSSDLLDQIVVSSPRSLPVEDGPQVDSIQDYSEIHVDQPSILPQAEEDSVLYMEGITEEEDLFDKSKVEQKLLELEEELKKKEVEMQLAKAKKMRVLEVWEKFSGIHILEELKIKKEPDVQDDLPPSQQFQECDVVDVKEESDGCSTVSTEINESTDYSQELLHLGDGLDAGSVDVSGLGSCSDPAVEGSLSSPSTPVVEPAVHSERHAAVNGVTNSVSSVVVDQSAIVPMNSSGEAHLGAQGIVDDSSGIHHPDAQEAQKSAVETSVSSQLPVQGGENNGKGNHNNLGGMTPRREERIRVRGLSDLLAIPPTQESPCQNNLSGGTALQSPSQNNIAEDTAQQSPSQNNPAVATTGETVSPDDRIIRDSFRGEKYVRAFKELQGILAGMGSSLMSYLNADNPADQLTRKENFGLQLKTHANQICRSIPAVVHHFQYRDEGCFASFLYFHVGFVMRDHRSSFTLDHMKLLIKSIFRYFIASWDIKSKVPLAIYFSKLYERMGMGDLKILPNNYRELQYRNSVVSQTSVQSTTNNNGVLPNPSTQFSSTVSSREIPTVPVVSSNQHLPVNTMPIRNQQVPDHLVNTGCGNQSGNFQGRVDVSSNSDSRVISNPPDVTALRALLQADSTLGLGSVPNVSVNPNQQRTADAAFVPIIHQHPGSHTNVSRELPTVSQSGVVSGKLSHMNVAAGQLSASRRNSLAGQNSNHAQNCMTLPQTFQPNPSNPRVSSQFSNPVHIQNGASMLGNQYQNHVTAQRSTTATIRMNNNAISTDMSMPGHNRIQHRRPSLPVESVRNQDSLQTQSLQGDAPAYFFVPGPGEAVSANPVHVPRTVVQTKPLHTTQSGYQSHPSSVNTDYHLMNPNNQGTHNLYAQRPVQRSDVVVPLNAQASNCLSTPYFPSPSHNGNAASSGSFVALPRENVNSMPIPQIVPRATIAQNIGAEGISTESAPSADLIRWKVFQQQAAHTNVYTNNPVAEMSNSTVVNFLSNSVDGSVRNVSQVTHSVYTQGSHVQHPQPGRPADIQQLMVQSVPRQSMNVSTEHTSTVLHAAPHQMNSTGIPFQSSPSYATQQHNVGMMGMGHQGSRPNQNSYLDHMPASAAKRQTQLPSLTSPVLRSSPSGVTEENDQAETVIPSNGDVENEQSEKSECDGASDQESLAHKSACKTKNPLIPTIKSITSKKKHPMKTQGQGTQCRPISNDSGYRSPSQNCDFGGNAPTFAGVCFSCQTEALLTCSRCQSIYYCSPACQTRDWGRHRYDCRVQVPVSVACKT